VTVTEFDYSGPSPVLQAFSASFVQHSESPSAPALRGTVQFNAPTSMAETVFEWANEGVDTVQTLVSYVLPDNVENLLLAGSGNTSGMGNLLANQLTGNAGANTLDGGAGNDNLSGGLGFDLVSGGTGDDTLRGGEQADSLLGGDGNDYINAGKGTDSAQGGTGNDTLLGALGNDSLNGNDGFDLLEGGDGNDTLSGELNADTLLGGIGDDFLGGGKGTDLLDGGDGNDTLVGGLGTDHLTGGPGADRFVFRNLLDGVVNIDTLTDLEIEVDIMELSASIFTALAGQIGSTVGINTHLHYNHLSGVLAYDADGPGAVAAVTFAVVGTASHPAALGNLFQIVA
jgi:serralysin